MAAQADLFCHTGQQFRQIRHPILFCQFCGILYIFQRTVVNRIKTALVQILHQGADLRRQILYDLIL